MIYPFLLVLIDFIALLASFTLAYILRVQIDSSPLAQEIPAASFIAVFVALLPFWIIINASLGLYSKHIYEKRLPELGKLAVGSFIGILLVIGYDFIQDESIFPARLVPVYAFFMSFILMAAARNALWVFRRYLFRYGKGVRGVMIIGSTDASKKLASVLAPTLNSGYAIRAIVGNKSSIPSTFEGTHFSSLDKALEALKTMPIHTVIQTELYKDEKRNKKIFTAVRNRHLQYKFIPAQGEFYTGKNTIDVLFGFPVISVHQTQLIGWGRVVKRMMDVVLSLVVLVIAIPLMLLAVIAIKITDPSGPVIFRHKRVTRFGNDFYIFKLRSMYWKYSTGDKGNKKSEVQIFKEMGREDLAKEYARNFKVAEDPRIMPVGKFIRNTSIDELPQLINVLQGHLSLVGPRAMKQEEIEIYRKAAGGDIVSSVKSGITGLWQVSGRSNISHDERVKLDLYYVQNWSLFMDLKILIKTIAVVLKGSGAR